MRNTKKVEVDGETVYLQKDWTGWRTIEPYKREDGTTNVWAGFKKSVPALVFLILLTGMFVYAYVEGINGVKNYYEKISANPVAYCEKLLGSSNNIPTIGILEPKVQS